MREKLLNLMKSEGLKPSQLAEMLEINPAGISHILAGRNKPGFDLLQKILRRFPQINPDWLMLDSDQMYRLESGSRNPESSYDINSASLQTVAQSSNIHNTHPADLFAETNQRRATPTQATPIKHIDTDNISPASMPQTSKPNTRVERVVIFYEDQTFESYTPNKQEV